jgi:hypothetical protein
MSKKKSTAEERLVWSEDQVQVTRPTGRTVSPAGVTAAAPEEGTAMSRKKKGPIRPVTAAAGGGRKWVSDPYLAPFGEATGDGRIFKVGSLSARDLPLPLLFQESSGWGHEGSVVVGRILEVSFGDAGITASGDYLADESVADAVDKAMALAEQGLGHVSVDLASVVAELVDEDGNPVDWDDLFDAWEDGDDMVVLEQVIEGELIACTQVATPAFASAKIRLEAALMDKEGVDIGVGDVVDVDTDAGPIRGRVTAVDEPSTTVTVQPTDADGNDTADAPLTVAPGAVTVVSDVDEPTEPAPASLESAVFAEDSAGTEIGVGDRVSTDLRDENGEVVEAGFEGTVTAVSEAAGDAPATVTIQADDASRAAMTVPADQVTVIEKATPVEPEGGGEPAGATEPAALRREVAAKAPALTAAGTLRPKKEWFDRQPLTGPTALTVTEDGQVFGHVAQWGECHIGYSNRCVTPPKSESGYQMFHVGQVVCDDGTRVSVGNLTLGPRHADLKLAWRAAIEHYDQAGAGVAQVRCHEDDFGIQFAGCVNPGITDHQLYDLRRCPVSGDWRGIGGELELIGVLAVNSGGFPTPRFATDDYGRTALVAAPGVRPDADGHPKRRKGGLSQKQLLARIKDEVKSEIRADEARRRRLARAAASIRRDPRSRMDELAGKLAR